jgi:hypothetical protein
MINNGKKRPVPQRHALWFDDQLTALGDGLFDVVASITAALDRGEDRTRLRRRREADERKREAALGVIVANLAKAALVAPHDPRLAVLTGNNGKRIARYTSPAVGRTLRLLLAQLDIEGLVDVRGPSVAREEASSVAPTTTFMALIEKAGVTLEDIGRRQGEETIVRSAKETCPEIKGYSKSILLDYPETTETMTLRAKVEELNRFLASADIRFVDDGLGDVDASNRRMRRRFSGDVDEETTAFNRHGRLYGGFWQNLSKDRRAAIRISGEQTALLDFSTMFTRLAYSRVGATPPSGDLYAVPGLEQHRDAVKLLINAMFFDDFKRTRWPKDADRALPEGWTVSRMRKAILRHHAALEPVLSTGIGMELMFKESEVMVEILTELMRREVVGLGLHDGLIVAASAAATTAQVMGTIAQRMTGLLMPVALKA